MKNLFFSYRIFINVVDFLWSFFRLQMKTHKNYCELFRASKLVISIKKDEIVDLKKYREATIFENFILNDKIKDHQIFSTKIRTKIRGPG